MKELLDNRTGDTVVDEFHKALTTKSLGNGGANGSPLLRGAMLEGAKVDGGNGRLYGAELRRLGVWID